MNKTVNRTHPHGIATYPGANKQKLPQMAIPIGTDTWKCSSSMITIFAMIGMQTRKAHRNIPYQKLYSFLHAVSKLIL